MKRVPVRSIALLLFLLFGTTFGQPTLKKTWVTQENGLIRIHDNSIDWILGWAAEIRLFHLDGDDIVLTRYSFGKFPNCLRPESVTYHIGLLTADSLVLIPFYNPHFPDQINPFTMRLVDSALVDDPEFRLDSLLFFATGCFGACPSFSITVNSFGDVRFIGNGDTEPFIGPFGAPFRNAG